MNSVMGFDEATSRRAEASYLTPDIVEQRRIILAALNLAPGEDVLDVGSGPGLLAADMSPLVAPGGSIAGVDPSESMLAIARGRAGAIDSAPIEYRSGEATSLPGADEAFDAVTSTQVYEYVADVPAALAEAHRVLRPGGRLLVLDTDWDSIVWRSSNDDRMRRVLRTWDEHLADPHLPRRLPGLLTAAGFTIARCSAIPLLNIGYDANTFSAVLIDFVTAFVANRSSVTSDELAAWAQDLVGQGADYFFSVNRYLFLAVKH
jgi:arsenite methyltransferase